MIAVISSTIAPSALPSHDGPRTNIDVEKRLAQTVESVRSLTALGFSEIYIADNSLTLPPSAEQLLAPARLLRFGHFPYRNKGVAEALLLLALSEHLPPARPIMKLSGRYRAGLNLCDSLHDAALAGLFAAAGSSAENLSTRAYAVRDRATFIRLLQGTLDELYASPWRVVGPRSLLSLVRRLLRSASDAYPYSDPLGSLEISAARWLKHSGLKIQKLEKLGIEGVLGSWINPAVQE